MVGDRAIVKFGEVVSFWVQLNDEKTNDHTVLFAEIL